MRNLQILRTILVKSTQMLHTDCATLKLSVVLLYNPVCHTSRLA